MRFFDDPALAARFRDWVKGMIHEEVNKIRPESRYGKIISVDSKERTAMVLLNGDESPVPVRFSDMSGNVMMNTLVRVNGKSGDKYVDAVWGASDGLWRSYPSSLASGWSVGSGYIDVRYRLDGLQCTVAWQLLFLDGDELISTGETDSLLQVEMPFAREGGNYMAVGSAITFPLGGGVTVLTSRMSSSMLPQYIQLHGEGASTGVKAGSPVAINDYRFFSGTVTYQISLFSLQLHLFVNGKLPGAIIQQ